MFPPQTQKNKKAICDFISHNSAFFSQLFISEKNDGIVRYKLRIVRKKV